MAGRDIRAGLRLRILLFFAAHGLGGVAIVAGALWLGHARGGGTDGFVTAGIAATFGLAALAAGLWLLFDENVARPIEALAADLRARAHGGVTAPIAPGAARHLGDLVPAADALARALASETGASAARVAAQTARLEQERARLTALLTEIPLAVILVGPGDRIALYDGQAAEALAQIAPPRLGAPITDYLAMPGWQALRGRVARTGREATGTLDGAGGAQRFAARLRPLAEGGAMLILEDETATLPPEASRPLVYDFGLLDRAVPDDLMACPLDALAFIVFDTETTGLLPHRDAVVQIAALRVVGGRAVPGERLETLVDPGRPIPAQATAVHGITDTRVAGAPGIAAASRALHAFAKGGVLVAHNAPFDLAFLRRAAPEAGVTWDHPVLDTVLLSAAVFGEAQEHTLDALCARLGIEIPAARRHTAMGDAEATAEALVRLLPMLAARGHDTLGSVIAACRRHGRLLADQN